MPHPTLPPSSDSTATSGIRTADSPTGSTVPRPLPQPPAQGSRRRRIWEMQSHAHCPVVGVCIPIDSMRRLVDKRVGGEALAADYELHCGVIAECRQRTRLAEAVQRELDRRYAAALLQAARCKTTEALAEAWQARRQAPAEVAGALWATLTHARCDALLEERVLQDVHMLQHQLGAADRANLQRLNELLDENAVLGRELAAAQQRSTRVANEQAQRIEQQQAETLRLRAELVGRDTLIASLRDELQALEASLPGLKSRVALARQSERQIDRIHDLERTLLAAQHEVERERRRADEALAQAASPGTGAPRDQAADGDTAPSLHHRAVLCVGGRPASVPVYRRAIEDTGGRFLHHDGGDEDSAARLDHSLAAADLVICQTGCISHDAYWRVKEHCKRTGKRCVFVEKPSRASLQRALQSLAPAVASEGDKVVMLRPLATARHDET
jgi:hypothetical protein